MGGAHKADCNSLHYLCTCVPMAIGGHGRGRRPGVLCGTVQKPKHPSKFEETVPCYCVYTAVVVDVAVVDAAVVVVLLH